MAFTDGERAILHALKAVSMQIMELEKRLESLGPGGALFQLMTGVDETSSSDSVASAPASFLDTED